jgi:hypothetical protein
MPGTIPDSGVYWLRPVDKRKVRLTPSPDGPIRKFSAGVEAM